MAGQLNLNKGINNDQALYVNGAEALFWNGTYFSWGYGATYNYFADRVIIGDATDHSSYMLYVKGNAYSTGTWGTSDVRFKKNISSINNALEKVKRIRGTSFEFRSEEFKDYQFAQGTQFGFIAQELETEFPELVRTEDNGYKSVNYTGMIPVLLEAIKEQQKIIDKVKAENKDLREENNLLNSRLERIETIVGISAENQNP